MMSRTRGEITVPVDGVVLGLAQLYAVFEPGELGEGRRKVLRAGELHLLALPPADPWGVKLVTNVSQYSPNIALI